MDGMPLLVVMTVTYGRMATNMKKYILIFTLILTASLFAQTIQSHHSTLLKKRGAAVSSETGEVFADDFEDGTLDAWIVYAESGNSISIATDTTHSGTYAAKLVYGGSNNRNVMSIATDNLNSIYFRCYMKFPANFVGGDGYPTTDFFSFVDGAAGVVYQRIKHDASNRPRNWDILSNGTTDQDANYTHMIHNNWFLVELAWERGTGSNGWTTFKVNGDSVVGIGSLPLALNADSIRIGTYILNENPNGYIYIDDVVIDSTTWVGAKP
ncbi:hypothetical protein LDC_2473 [sediment metagenome]|uniref:Uncharacterized protein n=1 Tax=sediment metagenome TaxID=749907 RepID=D9PLQ0_9ZZZZ